jgi:hypothetical protein
MPRFGTPQQATARAVRGVEDGTVAAVDLGDSDPVRLSGRTLRRP